MLIGFYESTNSTGRMNTVLPKDILLTDVVLMAVEDGAFSPKSPITVWEVLLLNPKGAT